MKRKTILPINLYLISHNAKVSTSISHLALWSLFFLTDPLKFLQIGSEVSLNCYLQVKVGPLKNSLRTLVPKFCPKYGITPASGHMLRQEGFLQRELCICLHSCFLHFWLSLLLRYISTVWCLHHLAPPQGWWALPEGPDWWSVTGLVVLLPGSRTSVELYWGPSYCPDWGPGSFIFHLNQRLWKWCYTQ